LGSDKTNSLTRDNGTYDIAEAEIKARRETENIINNNNSIITSPTSTISTPSSYLNTNGSGTNGTATLDTKRKWPAGKAYFLSKEILMTERTYKRDLEVINSRFRNVLSSKDVESLQPLFELLDSMVQHHSVFLRDLEHRIVLWEGRGTAETHRIGDVMLKNMVVLPVSLV
jgi:FERM/RhoGEF/pleckstrin domain protein 2